MESPQPVLLDDPRIDVRWMDEGEAAPGKGVWMNETTFELLVAKGQSIGGK
jgi:hypothetical protein